MSQSDVTLIDYGMGNLLSVQRGFEHCGANVTVSSDPDKIRRATRIVLPGVGAFAVGMQELCRQSLDAVVCEVAGRGRPLLGICLGMQMLLDESDEYGTTRGLGLIPGRVIPVPAFAADGLPQKVPHVGWNALVFPKGRESWQDTLLEKVRPGESAYFVHSFMASPEDSNHRVANCLYGGVSIAAVISRANIVGCQFHPEKSGEIGLKVLRQFLLR